MISRWFRHHLKSLFGAFGRIGSSPFGATLNVLVIAIALALPTAMRVLIDNAGGMGPTLEDAADITVYLKDGVEEERGRELSQALGRRDDVDATTFISSLEGLADLRSRSGFGGAFDSLTSNPIPHVIRVRPTAGAIDDIDALADALAAIEETESVQLDRQWIERLEAILSLIGRAANIVTVLLAAAVVLVIGNTIRLEINNRRTEIEVLKLVGATDGFIRRPFLYTGLALGSIGAITAALLIALALLLLRGPVRQLATLYGSEFSLSGLGIEGLAVLIGGGALLGWAGAWLAAARHLKSIEPA